MMDFFELESLRMVRLRLVEEKDAIQLCRIVSEVFSEYGMTFAPESWDQDLVFPNVKYSEPDAVMFVAEEEPQAGSLREPKILGMAGAHLEKDFGELHRLYIDPSARGLGLGKRLCQQTEEWVKSRGRDSMELWSDLRFSHAHRLYRSMGYQIFGSREIQDPDRSVEFGMRRTLGPLSPAPDPLCPELRSSMKRIPLEQARKDSAFWHRCVFLIDGMIDARTVIKKGFPPGRLEELFPQLDEIEVWVAGSSQNTLTPLGFWRSGQDLWHPSIL